MISQRQVMKCESNEMKYESNEMKYESNEMKGESNDIKCERKLASGGLNPADGLVRRTAMRPIAAFALLLLLSAQTAEDPTRRAFREYIDLWNDGQVGRVGDYFTDTYVQHYRLAHYTLGLARHRKLIKQWRETFPDLHVEIDDMLVDGPKIAARLTWSGTQKGKLFGKYAPTGKHATWTEIFIGRVENGRIVEGWEELDLPAMYEQLGVVP